MVVARFSRATGVGVARAEAAITAEMIEGMNFMLRMNQMMNVKASEG
jgi:hypothetical protein